MRRIKVDPFKAAIVDAAVKAKELEAKVPPALEPAGSHLSIDSLLKKGLFQIHQILKSTESQIRAEVYDRDTVMTLKDCMAMLHDLKKKEQEILDEISDEDLAAVANEDD